MSRYKEYSFNDGLDGVVIAKTLKQAVSILRHNGYDQFPKQDIVKGARKNIEVKGVPWCVSVYSVKASCSRMLGWCE